MSSRIPTSLPLLEYLKHRYRLTSDRPFARHRCLVIQHLLGSNVPVLRMLEEAGMRRESLMIVGKAYSSHPDVLRYLNDNGYAYCNAIDGYSLAEPYDTVLEGAIRNALAKLVWTGNGPLLLLDDGGKGIKMLHDEFAEHATVATCVELTTRGIRTLGQIDLKCPVVNIARSRAKTMREAPLIAQSMVGEFLHALTRWRSVFALRNADVLLIGYGAIGCNVAHQLRNEGFHVTVYDHLNHQTRQALSDGFVIGDVTSVIKHAGIVVGCVGACCLNMEQIAELSPGTLLVNMASSDTEFCLWRFFPHIKPVFLTTSNNMSHQPSGWEPWRSLCRVVASDTTFFVANGGFPIDFSGALDPIAPESIQLTRGLLVGGAIQAARSLGAGLLDFDPAIHDDILAEYDRLSSPPSASAQEMGGS